MHIDAKFVFVALGQSSWEQAVMLGLVAQHFKCTNHGAICPNKWGRPKLAHCVPDEILHLLPCPDQQLLIQTMF